MSGSGISWAICKSAPRSRQITTPATHRSVFYRPDALAAAQPTASQHWRPQMWNVTVSKKLLLTEAHDWIAHSCPTDVSDHPDHLQTLPQQNNNKSPATLYCWMKMTEHIETMTFNIHTAPFSGTTRISRYQKGTTNLDFTEAREWVAVASAGPYASLHLAPDR